MSNKNILLAAKEQLHSLANEMTHGMPVDATDLEEVVDMLSSIVDDKAEVTAVAAIHMPPCAMSGALKPWHSCSCNAPTDADVTDASRKALEEVATYARHLQHCRPSDGDLTGTCACGYSAAAAKMTEARKMAEARKAGRT